MMISVGIKKKKRNSTVDDDKRRASTEANTNYFSYHGKIIIEILFSNTQREENGFNKARRKRWKTFLFFLCFYVVIFSRMRFLYVYVCVIAVAHWTIKIVCAECFFFFLVNVCASNKILWKKEDCLKEKWQRKIRNTSRSWQILETTSHVMVGAFLSISKSHRIKWKKKLVLQRQALLFIFFFQFYVFHLHVIIISSPEKLRTTFLFFRFCFLSSFAFTSFHFSRRC